MSVADMIEVAAQTKFVAGLPVAGGEVGGDPGPHTSLGVFLGIKAAVKRALGKDSVDGLHIALQGAGSVASGVALPRRGRRREAVDRRRRPRRRRSWPTQPAARSSTPDDILCARGRRAQPQRARRDPRPSRASPALQRADRRRRRQQPAGDARGRRAAAGARHPLRARLCHQRRRHHQRLHRISRRRRRQTWCASGSRPSPAGSSRSGPKAQRRAATRRRSPTPWRRG